MLADGWEFFPDYFVTSSLKENGKDNILSYIDIINRKWFENPSSF